MTTATVERTKVDEKTIELFHEFCNSLDDVADVLDEDNWRDRLLWAWHQLYQFAEHLGPEFQKEVEDCGWECERPESPPDSRTVDNNQNGADETAPAGQSGGYGNRR